MLWSEKADSYESSLLSSWTDLGGSTWSGKTTFFKRRWTCRGMFLGFRVDRALSAER